MRQHAEVGDCVIGCGSSKRHRRGFLTYFMFVEEITSFDHYWREERFRHKKPFLGGSVKQAFGDNIYHRSNGRWQQADSFHSRVGGLANRENMNRDTGSQNVLISTDFAYWGGFGPQVPEVFRDYRGIDLCVKRGHRNHFHEEMVPLVAKWLRSLNAKGYLGDPLEWHVLSRTGRPAMTVWG